MSEESSEKSALVPRRRFPEFLDFGGWQVAQLSQALKFQPGFPFPSTGFNSEGVGLRLIRNRDLRSDENPVHFSGPYNGDFVVGDGDILVGMDGDFTPCVWRKGNALLNQRVGRVLPKEGSDQRFLFYFLSVHLKAIEDTTARTTVKHLSHSDVERICEPFPKKAEQQKIAYCLSSLDELITAETQKLATLKTHKKGLMQQLFPREGETVPRLRFPEFRGAREWDAKTLSELAENLDNRRIPVTESDRIKGVIPYYGASGIVDYIHDFIFDEDLLCVSEDGGNLVARTTPIAFSISGKTWVNNHAHVLKFDLRRVQKIVEDYLNSVSLEDYLTGMAQPKLNRAMLDTIHVPVPQDEDEQEAVAGCLSSLDGLITAQSQKIDALNSHKKGLMQQLFPVLDEVRE